MKPYIALLGLCAVLFFWKLGETPLIGLDEGLYAECSREMLASGNYLVPACGGQPFFEKPPLHYWLQAASMGAFGVNSFGARLPSAVCSFLLVVATVYLGGKLFGRRAGLFAGFALATSALTLGLARLCVMDALFALTITVSLGAFILARTGVWPKWTYGLFWAVAGLSALVKGPAGPALIFGSICVYLLFRGGLRQALRPSVVIGVALFAAVAVPWYALVQSATEGAFLREFIWHHNFQRAAGQDFGHNMPFYFYIPTYLAGFFPWSVFVPVAWARHVSRRPKDQPSEAALLLGIWALGVFLIFSLLTSKLASYIYPAYVPSALLVGLFWSRAVDDGATDSIRRCCVAVVVVVGLIAAALQVGPRFLPDPIPGLPTALIPMSASILIGSVAALLLILRKRTSTAFGALCAGIGGLLVAAVVLGMPIAARSLSTPSIKVAASLNKCVPGSASLIAYRLSPPQPAISFHACRPIRMATTATDLKRAIHTGRATYIIAQRDRLQGLPRAAKPVSTVGRYAIMRLCY